MTTFDTVFPLRIVYPHRQVIALCFKSQCTMYNVQQWNSIIHQFITYSLEPYSSTTWYYNIVTTTTTTLVQCCPHTLSRVLPHTLPSILMTFSIHTILISTLHMRWLHWHQLVIRTLPHYNSIDWGLSFTTRIGCPPPLAMEVKHLMKNLSHLSTMIQWQMKLNNITNNQYLSIIHIHHSLPISTFYMIIDNYLSKRKC